jgi:hypothetical protein
MKAPLLLFALLLAPPVLAEDVDPEVFHRIKQEAFLNSKVMDYMHRSNVDHVDHVLPGDLMQAAAVMATAVYHAANRDEMRCRGSHCRNRYPPRKNFPKS